MKRQAVASQLYVNVISNRAKLETQIVLACCIALIALLSACQPQTAQPDTHTSQADTRAADESALRKADDDWSKAAGSKDVDKTVSYYADDAIVLPPNETRINTGDARRKLWNGMITTPGFAGGWTATKVEVARSGEIGYVSGTYELTMNDAGGKPATDRGKYLEVWKKQANGSWKCTVDIWNSDLPVPASEKK